MGEGKSSPILRQIKPTSRMAMEPEVVRANIAKTFERGLPNFWDSGLTFRFRGEEPIAIVGGGPSLNETLSELQPIKTIMVCGSAHDHLVGLGIVPTYCVVLDPDPITANYLRKPHRDCTYLVASQCDDAVFDALEGHKILVWHCGGFGPEEDDVVFRREPRIGGGCTVTLRALSLAIVMGYGNQHYFGFDSCLSGDRHHAYEAEDVHKPIDVRPEGSGRVFYAAPYMLAQAAQFQDALRIHGKLFTPTVHGDGLIAEIMKIGALKAKEKLNVQR